MYRQRDTTKEWTYAIVTFAVIVALILLVAVVVNS